MQETGHDVVDMNTCTILRYPDLMRFRRDWIRKTGNKPAILDQIRDELDCRDLRVVPAPGYKAVSPMKAPDH